MKRWPIRKADGSITIVSSDNNPSWLLEEGDVLLNTVSEADLPDRRYRDCWKEDGGQLKIDLSKARERRLKEIRAERNKRLVETDAKWIEIKTKGGDTRTIESQKQTLRNMPEIAEQELSSKKSINTIMAYEPNWP